MKGNSMKNIPKYLMFAIFGASLILSGCGSDAPQKDTPAAQQTIQQAPAISSESQALYEQGEAAYGQFDYDKAIGLFDKAIAADKNNYHAISGKGVAMAMRGNSTGNKKDIHDGIAAIQKALALAPDDTASFYNLALALKIDGQYDESISWFKKVIDKEPDNTWSYYGIATIYGDQGKAAEAVDYLKKAAQYDEANVKDAARTQSHFDKVRNDKAFQAWLAVK